MPHRVERARLAHYPATEPTVTPHLDCARCSPTNRVVREERLVELLRVCCGGGRLLGPASALRPLRSLTFDTLQARAPIRPIVAHEPGQADDGDTPKTPASHTLWRMTD